MPTIESLPKAVSIFWKYFFPLNKFNLKTIKIRKKLCSQIIYKKTEMRALWSKFKNRVFRPNPRPAFGKWTFINVQNPFTASRSSLKFSRFIAMGFYSTSCFIMFLINFPLLLTFGNFTFFFT